MVGVSMHLKRIITNLFSIFNVTVIESISLRDMIEWRRNYYPPPKAKMNE
jgi:hypothetical protein